MGDQTSTPRGNSAGHATPNLGFRFLVDVWNMDGVHGINLGLLALEVPGGMGSGGEVEQ